MPRNVPRADSIRSHLGSRDRFVGGWMAVTMVAFYHNFLFVHSTGLSYAYTFAAYGIGVVYASYDATVRRLLAIGTVGGGIELLGDHFLVHVAGTLVYPSGYPFLLSSPAYMPFAWAILVTFMGYVALRLYIEFGRPAAYLGPAAFAFVAESGFESVASLGGGWTYTSAPLAWIGHAPLFVVVAEAVMFASSYYWVRKNMLVAGIGIGCTINVSYVGVYYLFVVIESVV